MESKKNIPKPNIQLVGVCGLFCPACRIFLAQSESLEKRMKMAKALQIPVEALKCDGCRSQNRFIYCDICTMSACTKKAGLDFCADCEDYPCTPLKKFRVGLPHRIELWESQTRIREVGYEKWFEEMLEHYSCSRCQTINSAYDLSCRKCGATPSCNYVARHKSKIMSYISKRQKEQG